ncbi:IS110 family transposase, partial [Paracoccus rhizosphaerae]
MKLFVGLDVSLEKTATCVISEHGKIVREAQAASEPEALARWIENLDGTLDLHRFRSGLLRAMLSSKETG